MTSLDVYYSHDVLGKRKYNNIRKANRDPIFQILFHISNYQITYVQLILGMSRILIQFLHKNLVKKNSLRECFEIFCNLHHD